VGIVVVAEAAEPEAVVEPAGIAAEAVFGVVIYYCCHP